MSRRPTRSELMGRLGGRRAAFARMGGGGSTGGTAFDPSSLLPSIWLDPSDLTTLFQNSNGTGAVTADADPVGYLGDKSGNARHCIQATAGARPLYKTSAGLRWLRFDGVDDFLGGSALNTFLTDTTYDIVCAGVMNNIATNASGVAISLNDSLWLDSDGYCGLAFRSNAPTGINGYNYDGSYDTSADAYTGGISFVLHMRHTGGNLSITQNARTTVTVASGTTDATGITKTLRLGGAVGIAFGELDLYGFIARQTLFDATELANIKTWMGGRVGVPL